jgi:hypothetical protein
MSREDDLQAFRTFVDESRWRFAKTYVESYPHEYTLEDWVDPDVFDHAIICIERWGVVEPFWSSRRKYFYIDERKYWHMGDVSSEDPEGQPGLINRSWLELANYRPQAKQLGYDDKTVDKLLNKWRLMIERARHG